MGFRQTMLVRELMSALHGLAHSIITDEVSMNDLWPFLEMLYSNLLYGFGWQWV